MAKFNVKPKNQVDVNKKPRVYFTCHPEDFEKNFEKICEDIFKTHDCAIYYTEDMKEAIAEDEKTVDLGRNNLFVVPVTYKLLSTPNRAMDEDIPYAFEHHIPVLPIMLESGIDEFYSQPDKFGELQYLNPFSTDVTEISYEDKLKKHLESILISNEMAERVRAAFDAYIFLSYRKKDRKYANELMRLVHSNPACRDIAIWFDEFLTPGESFRENIDKILKNSKLFALLVTPNLLEEPDGKPNFVMREEFPTARDMGKSILPAEMVETDKKALSKKFKGIPECVNPGDEVFYNQLLDSIEKIATEANNTPEHNYLIGRAYLDGIDVEINRVLGFELIQSAANAGLPEAMKQLRNMFSNGLFVPKSKKVAIEWGEKVLEYYEHTPNSIRDKAYALEELADLYCDIDKYKDAIPLYKRAYQIVCPSEEGRPLRVLNSLAYAYRFVDLSEAVKIKEDIYYISKRTYGPDNHDTQIAAFLLARYYHEANSYLRAVELLEEYLAYNRKTYGDTADSTLVAMCELAHNYRKVGKLQEAKELFEFAYNNSESAFSGDNDSIAALLNSLAIINEELGEFEKAIEYQEKRYWILCFTNSYESTFCKESIIRLYEKLENFDKLIEFLNKAKNVFIQSQRSDNKEKITICKKLIEIYKQLAKYPETIKEAEELYDSLYKLKFNEIYCSNILKDISQAYELLGDKDKAQYYKEKEIVSGILGSVEIDEIYRKTGDRVQTLEIAEKEYLENPYTININTVSLLDYIATGYLKIKNYSKAHKYLNKIINLQREYLENDHPRLISSLEVLSYINSKLEEIEKNKNTPSNNLTLEEEFLQALPESIDKLKKLIENKTLYTSKQRLQIREKLYQKKCQKFGELSQEALEELQLLAKSYDNIGNSAHAAELLEKAHNFAVKLMGDDYLVSINFYVDNILNELTKYYKKSNNTEKQLETAQLWYNLICKQQGTDCANAINALSELAYAYKDTGNPKKAAELLELVLLSKHTDVANSQDKYLSIESLKASKAFTSPRFLYKLAISHADSGNCDRALELLEFIYDASLERNGKEHNNTITALEWMSYTYDKMNNFEKTIDISKEVCELRKMVSGERSERTALSLYNLAIIYLNAKKYHEALDTFDKAYELYVENLGNDSEKANEIKQLVEQINIELGN